jgi:hypothetical protein
MPLDTIFRDFSKTALFVVSAIQFVDDPELDFCTQQYDERRRQEGFCVSGFPTQEAPVDLPAGRRTWWKLHDMLSKVRLCVQIKLGHKPNDLMVIQTTSYCSLPVNADAHYQLVEAFPDECRLRLGFDPTVFGDLCDALALTLWQEACYDRFLPIVGKKDDLVYDCDLTRDTRRKLAPKIIHSLNGKALIVQRG